MTGVIYRFFLRPQILFQYNARRSPVTIEELIAAAAASAGAAAVVGGMGANEAEGADVTMQ